MVILMTLSESRQGLHVQAMCLHDIRPLSTVKGVRGTDVVHETLTGSAQQGADSRQEEAVWPPYAPPQAPC